MNSINISAVLLTFAIYILFAIAYFGWGKLVTRVLFFKNQKNPPITSNIWIGWAFTLLIFQIIHLFFPLNVFSVIPIFIIGISLGLVYIVKEKGNLGKNFLKQHWLVLLLILILSIWIASHSMLVPTNYDSGLYHFNMIKWTNSYAIIPGLGNLHGRFAFNQSFFTYAAALNFFPLFNHGRSLANSFLLILSFVTVIGVLLPIFRQPSLVVKLHPFRYIPSLFIFPYLVYLAISSNGLASPSPDLTSTLLQLLMFIILANSIEKWIEGDFKQNNNAIYLTILAATAITIKLSNLAFSLIVFGLILLYLLKTHQLRKKITIYILISSSTILFIFMLRGFILSGVPLYPSAIGYGLISVDWAVPVEKITNEANWVYSWARMPHTHWSEVLGNWNWFKPWLSKIVKYHFIEVIYPLILAVLFSSIILILSMFRKIKKPKIAEILILLPAIASLLFWFFTAPGLRFANAIMFLLFLSSFILFLTSTREYFNNKSLIAIISLVLIFSNLNLFMYVHKHPNSLKKLSTSGWQTPKKVPLVKKVTKSGLEIYTPKKGDQCWDSEIPCTPYHKNSLELRVHDNVESGFMLNQEFKLRMRNKPIVKGVNK